MALVRQVNLTLGMRDFDRALSAGEIQWLMQR